MKWFDKPRKQGDIMGKWFAPRGGGYSGGPAPEGSAPPNPPKNPGSSSRTHVDPITPEERAIVAGFRADFERKYGTGKLPDSLSTSRVGHYVTPAPAIECSCGAVLTHSAYASLSDIINAAIAHGIDVERSRN